MVDNGACATAHQTLTNFGVAQCILFPPAAKAVLDGLAA
jgi:hypothetical protein